MSSPNRSRSGSVYSETEVAVPTTPRVPLKRSQRIATQNIEQSAAQVNSCSSSPTSNVNKRAQATAVPTSPKQKRIAPEPVPRPTKSTARKTGSSVAPLRALRDCQQLQKVDENTFEDLLSVFATERVAASRMQGQVTALFENQIRRHEQEISQLRDRVAEVEGSNRQLQRELDVSRSRSVHSLQATKPGTSASPSMQIDEPPRKRPRVLLPSDDNQVVDEYAKLHEKWSELLKLGNLVHENIVVPAAMLSETETEVEEDQMRGVESDKSNLEKAQHRVVDGWRRIEKVYGDIAEGYNPWDVRGKAHALN